MPLHNLAPKKITPRKKKNKSWMGYLPQFLQLRICSRDHCYKIFELDEWVKPIHTPQMLMLSQRKLLPGRKKNKISSSMPSVGNLLKGLLFQDQFARNNIFELCGWVNPIRTPHMMMLAQRKLMCLFTDYQFPADLKSSIFPDVKTVCFGGALTSASTVLALLGR